jgi:hypothetical protein
MIFRFLLILLLFTSCSSEAQQFLNTVDSTEDFSMLSGAPLSSKYGNISSIKVIFELKTEKLYFINSNFYKYHYEFCQFNLNEKADLGEFNRSNYDESEDRAYLLANLNYSKTLNRYFLDLSPYDQMPTRYMKKLYDQIVANTYIGSKLSFLLNTARLIDKKNQLIEQFPIILPEEIYENISFQSVSQGKTYGKLRFISNLDSLESPLLPTDIIVIKNTPMYLPLVSGIIVTEFQTPLSHLSILGQNRKIPICAYKSAFSDEKMRLNELKMVEFRVLKDTFYIVQKNHSINPKQQKEIILTKNLKVDSLIDVKNLNFRSANFAGNKAANFGVLNSLSQSHGFKVPEGGFAIPFYYYEQHLKSTKVDELINLAVKYQNTPEKLNAYLGMIREEILMTKLDAKLIADVKQKLVKSGFKTFRFRSSTNAEDAEGFSGAGLYDSKTVILNDTSKTIEKGILKVWASLWSNQAFLERSYFGINQHSVSMGILVHRSFPNEAVNGVAITKNLYRENYIGFVVNAQLGDIAVVDPPKGVTCDQFICSPKDINSSFQNTIEVITFSSLNHQKLVMTEKEIGNLAEQLDIIKRFFFLKSKTHLSNYESFGLDIEFKLDEKTRQLYIKQVRFYN